MTTGTSLTLPPGAKLTGVDGVPGWRSESRGRTVSWSGGSLVTGQIETFSFCARMPSTEGEVALRTSQRYSDGKVLSFPLGLLVARGSGEPAGSCNGDGGVGTGLFLAIASGSLVVLAALLFGLGRWLRAP